LLQLPLGLIHLRPNQSAETAGIPRACEHVGLSQLGSIEYFRREFPLTPDEAFLASQFDSFITSDLVMAARKTTDIEPYGPL
jgi:hypothetical protein